MRRFVFMALLLSFWSVALRGQGTAPESANTLLTAAKEKASLEGKTVFLIFHASWCKWCHKLDSVLINPDVKKVIDKYFVVTRLDVMEVKETEKHLENSGGEKMLSKFGGGKTGIPFYVFIDTKGKRVADSNVMPKKNNIGYPGSKAEIAAFKKLLKKTAPQMTAEDLSVVAGYFEKNTTKE